MKHLILWSSFLIALPFIVKILLALFLVYKHYFMIVLASTTPLSFSLLPQFSKNKKVSTRKPLGFDTSFTKEDEEKLLTARAKKRN